MRILKHVLIDNGKFYRINIAFLAALIQHTCDEESSQEGFFLIYLDETICFRPVELLGNVLDFFF